MTPRPGYALASWDTGYGDFALKPDLQTLRRLPWHPGTVLVLCDAVDPAGDPIDVSPRQILKSQLARLKKRDIYAYAGTELEFLVFRNSFRDAWSFGYRNLDPAIPYNGDYALLDTHGLEPFIRKLRLSMRDAGLPVTDSKGECNFGQQEINFHFREALATADGHVLYKHGAREIAAIEGLSLTFMAKFDEREGNSCHIHLSLRDQHDRPLMAADDRLSPLGQAFVAGLLSGCSDLALLFAPNINSYKRFAKGSFAPTAVAWGRDNRTCALRLVGQNSSLRIENRLPGGDVNPYLALAGMIAAGLFGVDNDLPLPDPIRGNAYEAQLPQVPRSLEEALKRFAESSIAVDAFGRNVVDHYSNMARTEIIAFQAAVTDWERYRGFERL